MFGLLWLLLSVLAAFVAAQLVRQPRFWRTESPAIGEVISVWLILTLVMAGSLIGLSEMLVQMGFGRNLVWLGAR